MEISTLLRNPKRIIKRTSENFSIKGLLLYFLPLPAIPAAVIALVNGDIFSVVINGGSYALFVYATWLLRQGIAAESKYLHKRITHPPEKPLKFYASVIVALTTGLLSLFGTGNSLFASLLFALTTLLAMYLWYGFDPRTEKTAPGKNRHGYTTQEISRTIDEAETIIASIETANDKINNTEFSNRIDRICEVARNVLKTIEENPGSIRRARKFLKVYLDGTLTVTNGFAKNHKEANSIKLEDNFRNLLAKIEAVFLEQQDKLLEDDLFDLDVQIEVLTTQLKQEGVL